MVKIEVICKNKDCGKVIQIENKFKYFLISVLTFGYNARKPFYLCDDCYSREKSYIISDFHVKTGGVFK